MQVPATPLTMRLSDMIAIEQRRARSFQARRSEERGKTGTAQGGEEARLECFVNKTLKHKQSDPRRDRQASPLRTT